MKKLILLISTFCFLSHLKAQDIFEASKNGDLQTVKELLKQENFNINATDVNKNTALHFAAKNGHSELAEYLLKHGAFVNHKNELGNTALHEASKQGHTRVIRVITISLNSMAVTQVLADAQNNPSNPSKIKEVRKALIDITNNTGATALYLASEAGYSRAVEVLIENRANPNHSLSSGMTPLHIAAENGFTEVMNPLIENQAEIDAITENGKTPLMLAVTQNKKQSAKLLLKHGTEVSLISNQGERALDMASKLEDHTLKDLLEKKMAEETSRTSKRSKKERSSKRRVKVKR